MKPINGLHYGSGHGSNLHEALVEMFRHRPSLAADLLRDVLHVELPEYDEVRLDESEFTDLSPRQYRADTMVVLANGGAPAVTVALEVQLRPDPIKPLTWPVYLTAKRARQRCPVVLLVVCVDPGTARWCRQPIELGHPGFTLAPIVMDASQVPLADESQTATPELLVFSAMAHGAEHKEVLTALVSALGQIEPNRAELYAEVVLAALPVAAHQYLEDLMATDTFQFQSNYARKLRARGEADALLEFLDARGIAVTDDVRERIIGCTDVDQVKVWVRRAVTADSADELFW